MQALTGAGNVTTNQASGVTTISVARPANAVEGDVIAIAVVHQQAGVGADLDPDAGLDRVGPAFALTADSRRPSGVYLRRVGPLGSEPASYEIATLGAAGRTGIIAQRIIDVPDDFEVYAGAWRSPINTDQAVELPQVIPAGPGLLIAFAYVNTSAGIGPAAITAGSGLTLSGTIANPTSGTGAGTAIALATEDIAAAGATGTRTFNSDRAVANACGYMVVLTPAAEPVETDMLCVGHRGIDQDMPEVLEESQLGTSLLVATHGDQINAVEVDSRNPDDILTVREPVCCHDETVDRTSPTGATGTVADMTTQELREAGITTLRDYLAAIEPYHFARVLVQLYAPDTAAQIAPTIEVLQELDEQYQDRIIVMTSAADFQGESIREAGWEGMIGCYGLTAANWSTFSARIAATGVVLGFVPPGAYNTHRAHVATMLAAGLAAGASTENDEGVMAQAEADGVTFLLTDNPAGYSSRFIAPANPPWDDEPPPTPEPTLIGWVDVDSPLITKFWPDATTLNAGTVQHELQAAYEQLVNYAPALAADEEPPARYVQAQIMHACDLFSAARADTDVVGITETGAAIRVRPLDSTVAQLLRPRRGTPVFG